MTTRRRLRVRDIAAAPHPGTAASRPQDRPSDPTDQTAALLGPHGCETPPEARYAAQAQALLDRRAWVVAELAAAERWARTQQRVRAVRAKLEAEGDPVPGMARRDWSAGLPEPGPAATGGLVSATPITGSGRRAPYWQEIGPPPACGPDDRVAATVFVRRIARALERGGWNNSHRAALSELYAIWRRRAAGDDVRFRVVGNVRGRLPKHLERQIAAIQSAEGHDHEPVGR